MRIALAGFGVVGQALAGMLHARGDALYRAHGLRPRLTAVMDSGGTAADPDGLDVEALRRAKADKASVAALRHGGAAAGDVFASAPADVLIDATPSDIRNPQPALERITAAMRRGRHVITVNKAPIAGALPALQEVAAHNRVALRFSGAVGAGLPILAVARQCARGDEVLGVRAILNGTTNYILWRMHEAGLDFDTALAEAQQRGYAERDPAADIDGIDSALKVAILASAALNRPATLADVAVEGIRGIAPARLAQAAARGRRVKLIGEIGQIGEKLRVGVAEVEAGGPLDVPESLFAVQLTLRYGGDVTLVGGGAGGAPTATAIVRDLVDIWHAAGSRP